MEQQVASQQTADTYTTTYLIQLKHGYHMKILYHHRTQAKGVEGVHINGVINALRAQGHEIHVVALAQESTQPSSKKEHPPAQDRSQGPSLIQKALYFFASKAPNFLFRVAEILYNCIAFFKLRKTLKKTEVDIIYERYAYFNVSGVLAAKLYKKPLILEVNIFSGLNDARAMALTFIAKIIEKYVFQNSDAIFVISDYLKNEMIKAYDLNGEKIHVHPNAVDPKQLEHKATTTAPGIELIDPTGVAICFLGRILPWYKLHELARIFGSIHKRHPKTQLIFIGDGPERENLEKELHQSGALDRVVFCGSVNHEQALALLDKCDIGVIPSTNMWGSPMKLFEYMGTGLPVVAPDIGVITAVMYDNTHGKTFEYDNFDAFERALESLIESKQLRESMGAAAKMHILENHTWERVSQHVIKVAETIIK